MIKTDEQVKKECIDKLKELIQEIESDDTSINYCFNYEVLNLNRTPICNVADVRYSLTMTKYIGI